MFLRLEKWCRSHPFLSMPSQVCRPSVFDLMALCPCDHAADVQVKRHDVEYNLKSCCGCCNCIFILVHKNEEQCNNEQLVTFYLIFLHTFLHTNPLFPPPPPCNCNKVRTPTPGGWPHLSGGQTSRHPQTPRELCAFWPAQRFAVMVLAGNLKLSKRPALRESLHVGHEPDYPTSSSRPHPWAFPGPG